VRHTFLLDENVAVRGVVQESGPAQTLWRTIAKNCHHKLAIGPILYGNYQQKIQEVRRRTGPDSAASMVALIFQLLTNADKTVWVAPENPSQLARFVRHTSDRYLADIAHLATLERNSKDCVFVTTDRQTRADFNRTEMQEARIQGVSLEQAVILANEAAD
jgi:hypothetical protein